MLTSNDIIHLKINRNLILQHQSWPMPKRVESALSKQIVALGDAAICESLNIDSNVFRLQLETARELGVSYVMSARHNPIGISAATSVIKSGNVLTKHLIMPYPATFMRSPLFDQYVVGVFVRGNVAEHQLTDIDDVEVAGWLPLRDVHQFKIKETIPTFKSKLSVVMVPCSKLLPLASLYDTLQWDKLQRDELCV